MAASPAPGAGAQKRAGSVGWGSLSQRPWSYPRRNPPPTAVVSSPGLRASPRVGVGAGGQLATPGRCGPGEGGDGQGAQQGGRDGGRQGRPQSRPRSLPPCAASICVQKLVHRYPGPTPCGCGPQATPGVQTLVLLPKAHPEPRSQASEAGPLCTAASSFPTCPRAAGPSSGLPAARLGVSPEPLKAPLTPSLLQA